MPHMQWSDSAKFFMKKTSLTSPLHISIFNMKKMAHKVTKFWQIEAATWNQPFSLHMWISRVCSERGRIWGFSFEKLCAPFLTPHQCNTSNNANRNALPSSPPTENSSVQWSMLLQFYKTTIFCHSIQPNCQWPGCNSTKEFCVNCGMAVQAKDCDPCQVQFWKRLISHWQCWRHVMKLQQPNALGSMQ